jgi:hypothetical protein
MLLCLSKSNINENTFQRKNNNNSVLSLPRFCVSHDSNRDEEMEKITAKCVKYVFTLIEFAKKIERVNAN